jgi:hypothetical protein
MLTTNVTTAEDSNEDELTTLARLRAHEQQLGVRLDEARCAVQARVADTREAAIRLRTEEEAECARDLARLRQERAQQLDDALTAVRKETTRRVAEVSRRGAANKERALARLLAAVGGGREP